MIVIKISRLTLTLSLWKPLAYSIQWKYKAPRKDQRGVTSYGFGHSLRFHAPMELHPKPNYKISWHSHLQNWLQGVGISTCNPLRQECTQGFECCSWSLNSEDKQILGSLSSKEPSVYVAQVNEDTCVMCGSIGDTRMKCCYKCGKHVSVEHIEGIDVLKHGITGKVVAL